MKTYLIYKNGETVSEIEAADHRIDSVSSLLTIVDEKGTIKAVFKKWDGFEIEEDLEEDDDVDDIQDRFPEIGKNIARRMTKLTRDLSK